MYEEYEKIIYDNLQDVQVFHPLSDREYWENIKSVMYDSVLERKKFFDNYTFEPLYASLYMEYHKSGNRTNYQKKAFERREALNVYAFLEAMENEGRYLEKILDIVWMTLEETQWALPAHGYLREGADALSYYKNPTLCLFSAILGTQLGFVYTLFKDKFDEMSRHISIRIKEQVLERVVYEYLDRDYGYTGLMPTARGTNNWTSCVNLGVISAALIFCDDKEKLSKVAAKVMASTIQQFSNSPEDGACDEGPSYWLDVIFDLTYIAKYLYEMTGGAVDFINNQKLWNISDYFCKTYAFGSYHVNFADADARASVFSGSMYEVGKVLKNPKLISAVNDAYKRREKNEKNEIGFGVYGTLLKAECLYELSQPNDIPPYRPNLDNYLESVQEMTAHQYEEAGKGLFFAAKGGYNGVSHNHNDVGTFIVYKNGERFICDAGRKAYSAITFSDKRYTLWYTRSVYHNLPVINGYEQKAKDWSREYSSENVEYNTDGKTVRFALDIHNCYENREDINKWRRSFVFDREKGEIRVSEEYSLKKCESVVLTYLSAAPFTVEADGIVMTSPNGETLKIFIDTDLYDIETDEPEMDEMMSNGWENGLYHIQMSIKNPKPEGIIEYVIK